MKILGLLFLSLLLIPINMFGSVEDNKDSISLTSIANLVNINPDINKWYTLTTKGKTKVVYHLENVFDQNEITLVETGLLLVNESSGTQISCKLWEGKKVRSFQRKLAKYKNPYYPICNGLVYIRLKRSSNTRLSMTEWATEALRKRDFGETIINWVKPFLVSLKAEEAQYKQLLKNDYYRNQNVSPLMDARINLDPQKDFVSVRNHLGISIQNGKNGKSKNSKLSFGKWYQTKLQPDVYVSLMIPGLVDKAIIKTFPKRVKPLSSKVKQKLVYLTAYDLSKYAVNYVIGTKYPGQVKNSSKNPNNLTGVVPIGSVPPYRIKDTVGVFIGGFKDSHGYFKWGPHRGKTSGYVENGVIIKNLQPGLATLYSTKDGNVDIIKWPELKEEQDTLLKEVVSARQNGVLIIDEGAPSKFVNKWGPGNWSGDVNGNLRTLRSAVCIQKNQGKRFLVFAAFTYATPSTMARVFQSYSCNAAMQLDMNAYMYMHNAVVKVDPEKKGKVTVEYLHSEMEYPKGLKRHRYVLDNNNRDFFYVFKRSALKPVNNIVVSSED